jgi:hypothetical protein
VRFNQHPEVTSRPDNHELPLDMTPDCRGSRDRPLMVNQPQIVTTRELPLNMTRDRGGTRNRPLMSDFSPRSNRSTKEMKDKFHAWLLTVNIFPSKMDSENFILNVWREKYNCFPNAEQFYLVSDSLLNTFLLSL